jgi:hypothetical protein
MRSMKEYENVFLDSQTRLLLSIVMFRRSCRDLVQGLPDTKIRELVDLRMGWDDKELREKLEWRLQGDFGIYMISVRQLNKRIDLLRRKLKLREDLTVSQPSKSINLHYWYADKTSRFHSCWVTLSMKSFAKSSSRSHGQISVVDLTPKNTSSSSQTYVMILINFAILRQGPSRLRTHRVDNRLLLSRLTGLIFGVMLMACTMH